MESVLKRTYSNRKVARKSTKSNGAPRAYTWTVNEYYKLGELGLFDGKRVQLIKGEIIEMSPMKSPHATSVQLVYEILRAIFATGYQIRMQLPMSFSKIDEPEPDIAVVEGSILDYADGHPKTASLLVEIADSSLRLDRTKKRELYAENLIEEYWILNLKQRCLEVHRHPIRDESTRFAYTETLVVLEKDFVTPLAMPASRIKVADMLPPVPISS